MGNHELGELLNEIADILEIKNIAWKPAAYRKAARSIEALPGDINELYRKKGIDGITSIPGIGLGIGKKIKEYLETGKIMELERLKKTIPNHIISMLDIPGLGPKKVAKLYNKIGITSIEKLENAAKEGKISRLEGFGEKSEEDILLGIELVKKGHERMILSRAIQISKSILEQLKMLEQVSNIDVAGSIRRMKETIKDIDILVLSKDPKQVMDYFTRLPDINVVLSKGLTKSSVVLKEGINCDLRIVNEKNYGGALAYFTGNKDHNIRMRQIALKKNMKLSEYGLFDRKNKYICGRTEQEIYSKLGLTYVEPEMRENTGELDIKIKLDLVEYGSIKGDLHLHTIWSDGRNSTEDMVKKAIELGYEYMAITDHSKSQHIANGLDEKRLIKHLAEIDKIRNKYKNRIAILKGSEVDILADGSLDYPNKILKELDIVVASIHSRFKDTKENTTKRMINAINNEHVKIIGHPTGRLINQREPYNLDIDAVIDEAKKNNVMLEINSYPSRLDLRDSSIRLAVEKNAKLIINTDSHSVENLGFMNLGVAQARRGWAEKCNIINTLSLNNFLKQIKRS